MRGEQIAPAAALAAALLLAVPARADAPIAVKCQVPIRSEGRIRPAVCGLDPATGTPLWRFVRTKTINFAVETTAGVLVGADDGTLTLLDQSSGKMKWTARVPGALTRANGFNRETAEGFLVSDDQEVYWFVGKEGVLKWTCDPRSLKADVR